jgi:hypothetical protein
MRGSCCRCLALLWTAAVYVERRPSLRCRSTDAVMSAARGRRDAGTQILAQKEATYADPCGGCVLYQTAHRSFAAVFRG